MTPLNNRIISTVVHGDPTTINTIYTPEGEVMLIDWDQAGANSFMKDFSWLSFWEGIYPEIRKDTMSLWELFKNVYGNEDGFDDQELKVLERVNHIVIALDNLPYTYFDKKDFEEYELVKKRLTELIEG